MNTPSWDNLADKYAALILFYCNVKGAVDWEKRREISIPSQSDRFWEIERYLSEYEAEVKRIEATK